MTWRRPEFTDSSPTRSVLVVASTFPSSDDDPVPAFVRELVVATRQADPTLRIAVLAPHDARSGTRDFTRHDDYDEYRFRYMWPARFEVLAGAGGIGPSLQRNRLLYLVVPFFLLAELRAILRLSRLIRPDVINAHWIIPQGVVAAIAKRFNRRPLVLTVHGGDVFTFNHPLAVALKRRALGRADRILVNSSVTLARAEAIYPAGQYTVIPMGVDLASFEGRTDPLHEGLRVLFVGRLSEEKGVGDLLDALALLRVRGVAFEARIAGAGPEADALAARAAELGLTNVRFMGWVSHADLGAEYRWADVFVGPSIESKTGWVEALGVVFIEASAAGLPVVTTGTGGMRDVVLDGATGYLVDEKSPEQIARTLETLAGDRELCATLGAAGSAHVAANFTWATIAARYAEVYRSAATPARV
jgi:glycosyltransferase involved in cell wall biosynthesis